MHRLWKGTVRSSGGLACDLQRQMLVLSDLFISRDGQSVDYDKCAVSSAFRQYKQLALELQKVFPFYLSPLPDVLEVFVVLSHHAVIYVDLCLCV